MKASLLYVTLIVIVFFFSYCSKGDRILAPKQAPTIVGSWVGTAQIEGQTGSKTIYYAFNLGKDSGMSVQTQMGVDDSTYFGTGGWHLSGNVFRGKVMILGFSRAGTSQEISATWDGNTGTFLSGIWKNNNSPGELKGTFSGMLRVN